MFKKSKKFNNRFLFAIIMSILFCACFATVFIFYLNYKKDEQTLYKRMNAVSENLSAQLKKSDLINIKDLNEDGVKEVESLLNNYITANGVCSMVLAASKNGQTVYILSLSENGGQSGETPSDFEENYLSALNGEIIIQSDLAKFSDKQYYTMFSPVKDADGQITGAVCLKYDLTYLNKKELEFILISFLLILLISSALVTFVNFLNKKLEAPFFKRLAYSDILSNLKNRTAFEEDIISLNSKRGQSENIILAVFDLNNLKDINDIYGHDAGDNYIKEFAKHFSRTFFKIGECYRTGGDEFVLIVKNNANEEKITQLIKEILFKVSEANKIYWFAYGVASYDKETDNDLYKTLKRADVMMYENKSIFKSFRNFGG